MKTIDTLRASGRFGALVVSNIERMSKGACENAELVAQAYANKLDSYDFKMQDIDAAQTLKMFDSLDIEVVNEGGDFRVSASDMFKQGRQEVIIFAYITKFYSQGYLYKYCPPTSKANRVEPPIFMPRVYLAINREGEYMFCAMYRRPTSQTICETASLTDIVKMLALLNHVPSSLTEGRFKTTDIMRKIRYAKEL